MVNKCFQAGIDFFWNRFCIWNIFKSKKNNNFNTCAQSHSLRYMLMNPCLVLNRFLCVFFTPSFTHLLTVLWLQQNDLNLQHELNPVSQVLISNPYFFLMQILSSSFFWWGSGESETLMTVSEGGIPENKDSFSHPKNIYFSPSDFRMSMNWANATDHEVFFHQLRGIDLQ